MTKDARDNDIDFERKGNLTACTILDDPREPATTEQTDDMNQEVAIVAGTHP